MTFAPTARRDRTAIYGLPEPIAGVPTGSQLLKSRAKIAECSISGIEEIMSALARHSFTRGLVLGLLGGALFSCSSPASSPGFSASAGVAGAPSASASQASGGGTASSGAAAVGGSPGSGGSASAGAATAGSSGASAVGGGGASAAGAGGAATAGTGGVATAGQGGGSNGGASAGSGGSSQTRTSPGCGSSAPLKSGNFTESINGTDRKWMIDVPANYDTSHPYRLIFVWHPLGGSGSQVASDGYNGLKPLANNSTVFATADGLMGSNSETSGTGWWNANGGDMKLVQAMLDKINGSLCIDQDRIFSTGFSFGGMMSYTLPFEFNVFRAVAPCSGKGGVIPYNEKYTNPVPILAFRRRAPAVASPMCRRV